MEKPINASSQLFDAESLRSRLMGDDELVSQLLEACVPEINANFRDFVEALEEGNWDTAERRIHAMKGASQNADLVALSALTLTIERSLREGDSSVALQEVERLQQTLEATIGELRRYLNS